MRTDRLWLAGGVIVAVGLALISWFALIAPQHSLADSYDTQTQDAQGRILVLRNRLAELRKENANLATYTGQLQTDEAALPTSAGTADLLRNLHSVGDLKGVTINGVVIGDPNQLSAVSSQLFQLPVTLTVSGPAAKLAGFLDDLQNNQSRALLLVSVAALPSDTSGSLAGGMTLTIDLRAFISTASTSTTSDSTATANTPH
jgi:Tfp pilus assembly protein PilO